MFEASRVVASRECPWFSVVLCDEGILVYRPIPGLVLTHPIALEVMRVGLQIVDSAKPTMVLMQDIARVDRDARACFASEDYMRLCSQTALVVGSTVSRVIGSFFVGLNQPTYPVKIFDDPELALEWLRGFLP